MASKADLSSPFGERFYPLHPADISPSLREKEVEKLVRDWVRTKDAIGPAVWSREEFFVGESVGYSVCRSVGIPAWESTIKFAHTVGVSVWNSIGDAMGPSVILSTWDSIFAYFGSLFPEVKEWKSIQHKRIQHKPGKYPFQPAADLWRDGLVAVEVRDRKGKWWVMHPVHGGRLAIKVMEVTI